jgi:hypothetical protein
VLVRHLDVLGDQCDHLIKHRHAQERNGSAAGGLEQFRMALVPLVAYAFLLEEDVARLLAISDGNYPI